MTQFVVHNYKFHSKKVLIAGQMMQLNVQIMVFQTVTRNLDKFAQLKMHLSALLRTILHAYKIQVIIAITLMTIQAVI